MQTTRPMHNAIDIKTKVLLPRTYVILVDFGYTVQALWHYCSQTLLNYLALISFDFDHT
jgi:hypothetical protein